MLDLKVNVVPKEIEGQLVSKEIEDLKGFKVSEVFQEIEDLKGFKGIEDLRDLKEMQGFKDLKGFKDNPVNLE